MGHGAGLDGSITDKNIMWWKTIYFLHAPKAFLHFDDIMNIHPCLDKYLFLLVAWVYMNIEFQKIPSTTPHNNPSCRSQVFPCGWAGRQTVVPYHKWAYKCPLSNQHHLPSVTSCTCYSTDKITIVFKNACN